MADAISTTRRTLIKAFPFIGAAMATPLAAPVAAQKFDLQAWLDGLPPIERANYHQMKLAEALCEASPGKWRTATHSGEHDFVLVIRDAKTAPEDASVFVQQL